MSALKLPKSDGDIKVLLERGKGLLLLSARYGSDCFLLERPSALDCSAIAASGDLAGARFVGDPEVLEALKKCLPRGEQLERQICIDAPLDALYAPSLGKIRVRKDQVVLARATERPAGKKKVLIIDDSKTIQKLLAKIVSSSKELEVLDVADRPSVAKAIIEKERPDLITLDIHMPEMNGVEFLKSYLGTLNIPVVMVSSVSVEEGPLVMEALSSGALSYIQKPTVGKMSEIADDILEELEFLSNRKEPTREAAPAKALSRRKAEAFNAEQGLIAIGSSTGGTKALQEILTALPAQIPPVVVVQHIPAVFSKALAQRLDSLCPFEVKEAEDGELVVSNKVYIAPGGQQMRLEKRGGKVKIVLTDDEPVNRFKPSVDYMFNSIPALNESNVVAAILTGMGKDGAQGLLKLKESGAMTLAQDEASCVVFGMPKEAIRLNAARKVVALNDMAQTFVECFGRKSKLKSA